MKTKQTARNAASQKITVYIMKIPDCPVIDPDTVATFPEYRRNRILSAGTEKAAAANYISGLLMRDILGIRKDDDIIKSEKGKPFLADGSRYFSLSHDGKQVILAVGPGELGADTETIKEIRESVKKRVFKEEELAYCGDDIVKSTRLWTRLEAALKLSGDGIGGIKDRSFSLLEDREGLYFASLETAGSVISIACADSFETEVCDYTPQ